MLEAVGRRRRGFGFDLAAVLHYRSCNRFDLTRLDPLSGGLSSAVDRHELAAYTAHDFVGTEAHRTKIAAHCASFVVVERLWTGL
jgi:hypothetical protein